MSRKLKVGDHCQCRPTTFDITDEFGRLTGEEFATGTIVYIHPKGRFAVVEFEMSCSTCRESFALTEILK